MFINQSKEDSLRVNMDIFFPRMPCDFISVDQQDVIGTHSINLKGDLQKRRFLDGAMIESFVFTSSIPSPPIRNPMSIAPRRPSRRARAAS